MCSEADALLLTLSNEGLREVANLRSGAFLAAAARRALK